MLTVHIGLWTFLRISILFDWIVGIQAEHLVRSPINIFGVPFGQWILNEAQLLRLYKIHTNKLDIFEKISICSNLPQLWMLNYNLMSARYSSVSLGLKGSNWSNAKYTSQAKSFVLNWILFYFDKKIEIFFYQYIIWWGWAWI